MANDFVRGLSCLRGEIWMGNAKVGLVKEFAVTEEFSHERLSGLGYPFAINHELTAIGVSGTIRLAHLLEEPWVAQGDGRIWYNQAPVQATPTSSPEAGLINFEAREFTLVDRETKQRLVTILGYKPTSRTIGLADGSILMHNCNFVAIKLLERRAALYTPAPP